MCVDKFVKQARAYLQYSWNCTSGPTVTRRMQYSLKHINTTTINKSMELALLWGIAVEISKKHSPWEAQDR